MQKSIDEHIRVFKSLNQLSDEFEQFVQMSIACLEAGGKLIFAGNGGSASDAQHISTEFVVKYCNERKALPAVSLTTDTSAMTAISNDFGAQFIFSRQLEAIGKQSDLLVLISTSGMSENLLQCADVANSSQITTVGLLGKGGGKLKKKCSHSLIVPSANTARIQEAHIFLLHMLIETIEHRVA